MSGQVKTLIKTNLATTERPRVDYQVPRRRRRRRGSIGEDLLSLLATKSKKKTGKQNETKMCL